MFHETTAAALAPRRALGDLVADAPADAEEALVGVRVLPGWVGLVVAVGGALMLWAAIFAGLRWVFAP